MRAALYHRVSTVDQDEQLARGELERAAAARGLEVHLVELETGSGGRNDRPGLQRVLEAARRGRVDAVLVWKLDRFGRSALDVLTNIRALSDAGVRFVAVSQGLDVGAGGDAMGRLILTVLAAVAEFERDLIRERTKLGLAGARRRGKQLGRPRKLSDDQVRAARHLRDEGRSWSFVARLVGAPASTIRQALAEVYCIDCGMSERAPIHTGGHPTRCHAFRASAEPTPIERLAEKGAQKSGSGPVEA